MFQLRRVFAEKLIVPGWSRNYFLLFNQKDHYRVYVQESQSKYFPDILQSNLSIHTLYLKISVNVIFKLQVFRLK
jgi:hypothetical protein